MIVAERLRGGDPVILNPRSRTMGYQPTAQAIAAMRASMNTPNLEISRLNGMRGLGDGMSSVPTWVPWAIGGLVVGLGGGYAVYRMRRKGKR